MREGWVKKKLGDVCTLQRGFDLPKRLREKGKYPLISSSGCIDSHTEAKVSGPGVVTGRSGSIGSTFFIDKDFWPLNTTLYVKDFHGNDPQFVFRLLEKFDLKSYASGAGVPTLNRNNVHSESVTVPSAVSEQKRIVAILDEVFAGIDDAIANTEKNLTNARKLFESYLNFLLLAVASSDPTQTLSSITDLIIDCEHKTAPTQEVGIPSIRTPNIGKGHLILNRVNRVSEETYKLWTRRGQPESGDLILAREAPAGNVGVIPDGQKVCLGQRTVLIRPKKGISDPQYLAFLLLHPIMQERLLAHSTGATVQHVNMKDIRNLSISGLPSVPAQVKSMKVLMEVKDYSTRLEAIYQQKLTALNELKQSILQKAFIGELTADTAIQATQAKEEIAA